jgi:hypothetical protein
VLFSFQFGFDEEAQSTKEIFGLSFSLPFALLFASTIAVVNKDCLHHPLLLSSKAASIALCHHL